VSVLSLIPPELSLSRLAHDTEHNNETTVDDSGGTRHVEFPISGLDERVHVGSVEAVL
jgi:hypothetical protein